MPIASVPLYISCCSKQPNAKPAVNRDHFDEHVEASLRRGMSISSPKTFPLPLQNIPSTHPPLPFLSDIISQRNATPISPHLILSRKLTPPDLPIITTPHAKSHLASASKDPSDAFTAVTDLDFFDDCLVNIAGKDAAIRVTGMPGKHVPPGPGGVAGMVNDLLGTVGFCFFFFSRSVFPSRPFPSFLPYPTSNNPTHRAEPALTPTPPPHRSPQQTAGCSNSAA